MVSVANVDVLYVVGVCLAKRGKSAVGGLERAACDVLVAEIRVSVLEGVCRPHRVFSVVKLETRYSSEGVVFSGQDNTSSTNHK